MAAAWRSVIPEDADRAYLHERYFGELVEGIFRGETRAGVAAIIDRMAAQHDLEAVILGGTELLFRGGPAPSLPMLDTTLIHVDAAIARLLAEG